MYLFISKALESLITYTQTGNLCNLRLLQRSNHTGLCGTYIDCPAVENLIRNVNWSNYTSVAAGNCVSCIGAKRRRVRRQRTVSETVTTIKPQ